MTAGGARSARNIEPAARQNAEDPRKAASAADDPEDATSRDYFNEPPSRSAARTRAGTGSQSSGGADEEVRVTDAIERLSDRIESAESRQALAIAGVERSVRDVIARIDASERDQMQTAARVEDEVRATRTDSKRLAERLSRLETGSTGLKSVEALRALETAVGKVAGYVHDSERRSQESLAEIRSRMERIDAAEGATVSAIRELRTTCTALDERLSLIDHDGQDGIERLAQNLSHRVEQVREELAQQLAAAADARFDRVEEALARMSEHVRAAEQRSAGAIERMGREVLEVAQTLSGRVQSVEQHSVELGDRMGADMSRIATAVEARLVRSDTIQAQALEKLGGEIARITERLADRITNAERRSAEAIDDIGEQVARVTERISHRHERYTSELADRIRQSEDRTARLLDEARNRLDGRLGEAMRPAPQPAAAPFLAAPDPQRDETLFLDAPFPAYEPLRATPVPRAATVRVFGQATTAKFGPPQSEDTSPIVETSPPQGLGTEAAAGIEPPAIEPPPATLADGTPAEAATSEAASGETAAALALPEDEALFNAAEAEASADIVSPTTALAVAEERPLGPWDMAETKPTPRAGEWVSVPWDSAEPGADATLRSEAFEATQAEGPLAEPAFAGRSLADETRAEETLAEEALAEPLFEDEAPPLENREALAAERQDEPMAPTEAETVELEPVTLEPNIGFDDEDDFSPHASAEPPMSVRYGFPASDYASNASDSRSQDQASPEPPPALTTRDIIDRARAAARSAHERDRPWRPMAPANESLLANVTSIRERPRVVSGVGGLMIASLIAAVGIAGGGFLLFEGKSGKQASPDALAAGGAHAPAMAAVAFAPKAANSQAAKDMTSAYSQAVAEVTAGQAAGGVAHLQKLADSGYAPAQFYLAELYQDGKAGLKKDPSQSRHWLERAADGGDRTAMHNLALDEHEGIGGARDAATAAEWFRRAAEFGLLDSQYNLAALYERGDGVGRNLAEAYKWYLIAGRAGDPEARAGAQRVRAGLKTDERQVAERAAAEFQPTQPAAPGAVQAGAAPVSPDLVTAQRMLNKLGYYQGPMDGSTSPAIHLAIAAYQRDQGLPITGAPDPATLAKLTKQ